MYFMLRTCENRESGFLGRKPVKFCMRRGSVQCALPACIARGFLIKYLIKNSIKGLQRIPDEKFPLSAAGVIVRCCLYPQNSPPPWKSPGKRAAFLVGELP
jgi:hypothetical protein